MAPEEGLMRLADEAGIEARYWDIRGGLHEASLDTIRVLLSAFGVPATTDAEIVESRTMLAERPWNSCLPPVVIAQENCEISVPFRLPLAKLTKTIRWSLHLETGEIRGGECDLDALPIDEICYRGRNPVALRQLRLSPLPLGYHAFCLVAADMAVSQIIVAPKRCYVPDKFERAGCWGIGAQLYGLRSEANWGIGDFGDLRSLIDLAATQGADVIGLNPLHALFLDTPDQASPYSPSSRLFRNPLYLDVTAIPDLAECPEARGSLLGSSELIDALHKSRSAALVDYGAVATLKLHVLKVLHRSFIANHVRRGTIRGEAFLKFVKQSGTALHQFAVFQMLSEHFGTHDWMHWPGSCQKPSSDDVQTLQHQNADRVSFFKYLHWLCEEQIFAAANEAGQKGMAIGLYNDLSVSVDATSADHWSNQDLFAGRLRVGAPPDPFNEAGQEWGIIPFNPRQLPATGYAHFIALMRANMRHAGALRVDHVMGFQRLFLIPSGAPAASGTYVRYPLEDLLAITALESRRNRCLIVGEDLGTVPEGFRERMEAANVLSSRIFYFERTHDRFFRPRDYPALAVVSASTHDLATLRGFWSGNDIAAKSDLGAFASEDLIAQAYAERGRDKRLLLRALAEEGLWPESEFPADIDRLEWTPTLARAIHLYLARTPSVVLLVQLDDLADVEHQANLPGSTTEYPNWRRRLTGMFTDLLSDSATQEQMEAIHAERMARTES